MKIALPSVLWQNGILLIMKAFNGVPSDFDDWSIIEWDSLIEISKKLIEADYKKGVF